MKDFEANYDVEICGKENNVSRFVRRSSFPPIIRRVILVHLRYRYVKL